MLLDVFDKNFIRIDEIARYSYATYFKCLNSLGDFEIRLAVDDVAKNIVKNGKYILLEKDVCGIITYISSTVEELTKNSELIVKGYLAEWMLSQRCFITTANYSGTTTSIVRQMVYDNCISPTDTKRELPIVLSLDEEYIPQADTESIQVQVTGDDIQSKIESLLDAQEMGYELHPVLSSTNITNFELRVIKGKDKTIGNLEENDAVVFSSDLKNILEGNYVLNINDYKNMAYVAGEGEAAARVIVETGDSSLEGLERFELYVDARDLQSESGEETLTPEEYQAVLTTRGNEKLKERVYEESYLASINQGNTQFEYGTDYKLGDLVTIRDPNIDIDISARVTQIKASSLGEKTMIDVTFGYYKLTTEQKLKRGGIV